jgi:protein-arginine deiminase
MTRGMFLRQSAAGLVALSLLGAFGCGGDGGDEGAQPLASPGAAGGSAGNGSAGAAGGEGGAPPVHVIADLRADVNRNGSVDLDDPTEDADEETWDGKHGAIFLANLDDDAATCPVVDASGKALSDGALAACNDAADDVVNGPDDLLDLARLRTVPWPDAPDDASAKIALTEASSSRVRLFRKTGDTFELFDPATAMLAADELRTGVELGIEAKDVVRDAALWDGVIDVRLEVHGGTGADGATLEDATDTVRLRVAPIVTGHHLQPVDTAYVTKSGDFDSQAFRKALKTAATASGVTTVSELTVDEEDQWTQDFFETASMSMPAPGGKQVMRVALRSANVYNPSSSNFPLRRAGRIVFTALRGKDFAGIVQYDKGHPGEMDSLDSFGNLETIPPYTLGGESFPQGRILRGSIPDFHPDASFVKMMESQKVQPPVYVDTSWLSVGHVDETMSFVKASTPRGWVLLINDPTMAKKMLEDQVAKGNGAVQMFVGRKWLSDNGSETAAAVSIEEVLADTDVMSESAKAAVDVEAQLAVMKEATGLADDEIVRVPYLHMPEYGYSIAYQPGTVNGIYLAEGHFAPPDPHGPIVEGVDIFRAQLEEALGNVGVTVHFIEDWNLYHRLSGEVHCGTNAMRTLREGDLWWESGR